VKQLRFQNKGGVAMEEKVMVKGNEAMGEAAVRADFADVLIAGRLGCGWRELRRRLVVEPDVEVHRPGWCG